MPHRWSAGPRPTDPPDLTELADAGRVLVDRGLVLGSAGNVSVRADGDTMWISGAGAWLDCLDAEGLIRMAFDGRAAGRGLPSSDWLLHARIYQARPDVGCVLHLHPQASLLLDTLGKPVRFLTQDHVLYAGRYARVPYYAHGSDRLADAAADALRDGPDVVLLGNHGTVAVGEDVEWALRAALVFEQAAELTYRALLLGDERTAFPASRLRELGAHVHACGYGATRAAPPRRASS